MNNPYSFHQQMFEEHNRSFQHMVEHFIYSNNNNKVNNTTRSSSHYNNNSNNNKNNNSSNNNFIHSKSSSMGGNSNISHNIRDHNDVATIEPFTPKLLPPIGNNTYNTSSNNYKDGSYHSPSAHEMVISIPNEPVYNRSRRQDTLTREGISTARSIIRSSDKSSRNRITSSSRSMRRRSEAVGSKHSHNDAAKKDSDGALLQRSLPPGSTLKINVDDKKINTVNRSEIITRTVNTTTVATAPSHKAPSSMVGIIDHIFRKKLDKKYDRKLLDQITNDIILQDLGVSFHDIAGNDVPKRILNEAVVLPLLIPEFFTGIRQPWKVFNSIVTIIVCMDDLWLESCALPHQFY